MMIYRSFTTVLAFILTMSAHNRARRIFTEASGASATSNDPVQTPNNHFDLTDALQSYLESNPPTTDEILLELERKDRLGPGMATVGDRRKSLIENVVNPFDSDDGKNILSIVNAWNANAASTLRNAIPKKNNAQRTTFSGPVIAKCIMNLYYAMLPINEAIQDENEAITLQTASYKEFWKSVFDDSVASWVQTATDLAINTKSSKVSSLYVNLDARQA